jgi:hypothetical protein
MAEIEDTSILIDTPGVASRDTEVLTASCWNSCLVGGEKGLNDSSTCVPDHLDSHWELSSQTPVIITRAG